MAAEQQLAQGGEPLIQFSAGEMGYLGNHCADALTAFSNPPVQARALRDGVPTVAECGGDGIGDRSFGLSFGAQ